jgi:myo-inositol 2-dehydrogenase / D-chiro-inositol 1-dehydrogenase
MADRKSITRRDFLRQAGGAAACGIALPTILTSKALGAPGVPAASERILVGVIGIGGQGNGLLSAHLKNTVAVCDVDQTRLAAAKDRVEKAGGRCEAYTDYRKLLENKDIDAVVISTPDHWHALPTIDACEAGKDVYCEKPLTLTIAEGQAMVKAARRYNRIVQTGSQQRSDAKFRLACELVRSGRIGKVHTVRVGILGVNFKGPSAPDSMPPSVLDYDLWLGPAPMRPYNEKRVHYNFRFFWDYSGGQLTNWGAHHLDIAQWGLGMDDSGPVSVEAQARYHKDGWYEVPEWCEITYVYANGVTMVCGMDVRAGTTFEGEKGTIYVNRGKLESTPAELVTQPLAEGDRPEGTRLYESKSHHGNWLECIKSRNLPICDVAIGHRSATVCHLGNIAIRTGRKVNWDPVKEEIVGDAEVARRVTYAYRAPWKL